MSNSNLMETFMAEDLKARRILDVLVSHDGEVKLGSLRSVVVDKLKAMSRATFYNKLKDLERNGWIHREARMEGNTAVAYIVLAEPYLGIIRQGSSDPFVLHAHEVMERLRDIEVSAEEKEEIMVRLLKEYMNDSVDWLLDLVRECLQAQDLDVATLASVFSVRYLFGLRLTTIGVLYWTFKEYGDGALRRVEEVFSSSRGEWRLKLLEEVRLELRRIEDLP